MSQPLWILKTAKDRYLQRLVHMSADLARQIGTVLENSQNGIEGEVLMNLLILMILALENSFKDIDFTSFASMISKLPCHSFPVMNN